MAYAVPRPPLRVRDLPFRAVGGQPPFRPDALERFVSEPRVAVLAYVRRDGRPHQSPLWYTYRDGAFLMSTVTGSPKHKALMRDGRVSLTIQDETPPYRAAVMEGTVELSPIVPVENPGDAADPVDGMATRYLGRLGAAAYDRMTAEAYRATGLTLVTFRPTAVSGFDNSRTTGRLALAFVRLRSRLPVPRRWL